MLFSTIGQSYIFLWMMGAGFLIAALYAIETALRRLLYAGFWLTLALDALFGLGAGLVLIVALVMGNYGRLRLYELLGALLGVVLFSLGIFPPMKRLIRFIGRILYQIFHKISQNRAFKVIFK